VTLTVSLKITGDASALIKAADDASAATRGLQDVCDTASKSITNTGKEVEAVATGLENATKSVGNTEKSVQSAIKTTSDFSVALQKTRQQVSGYVSGIDEVIVGYDAYGMALRRSKADMDALASAQIKAEQAAAAQATAIQKWRDQLDPVAAVTRRANAEIQTLNGWMATGVITQDEHAKMSGMVKNGLDQIGHAAEASAGQIAMGRRIVVTNLMNMGQVAMATGGSFQMMATPLPDVIYGLTQMGRGAVFAGSAVLILMAALAVTAGAVMAHDSSLREVAVSQRVFGDSLGLTKTQLESMAQSSSSMGQTTVREARSMQAAMMQAGSIGAEAYKTIIATARDYAVVTGTDATQAAAALAKALADPAKAARDLDDQLTLLTPVQREHIELMSKMGEKEKAQAELAEALQSKLRGLADDGLGNLGKAWRAISSAASDAWDAMGKWGKEDTPGQALAAAQKKLDDLKGVPASADFSNGNALQIQSLETQIGQLKDQISKDDAKAANLKNTADRNSAVNAGLDTARGINADIQTLGPVDKGDSQTHRDVIQHWSLRRPVACVAI